MRFKSGMITYAMAYLVGVLLVQQLSVLPEVSVWQVCSIILVFASLWCFRNWLLRIWLIQEIVGKISGLNIEYKLIIFHILLIFISISSSIFAASQQLSYRLSEPLSGKDILVTGYVADIPVKTLHGQRFEFNVESVVLPDKTSSLESNRYDFPEKIRVSWYGATEVGAGESWQLLVRLKPPHGFQNPGGFDYEAWLFQQGIHATGYVRHSDLNQSIPGTGTLSQYANKLRQQISEQISKLFPGGGIDHGAHHGQSMIKALAVGDKSTISSDQWQVLAATGTSHLMAISGLHIGLASLFAYVLVRRLIPGSIMLQIPAQHLAIGAGLIMAFIYSVLAGFSIPTQRAFIMLSVIAVMMTIRRSYRPMDTLGLALIIVLLLDQAAVLSIGFWFSFAAVAVIFLSINKQDVSNVDIEANTDRGRTLYEKFKAVLKQWLRLQLMISVFLLPLSLFMFQQASLVSPLANLVMIPYVSLLVVPLVLLAILVSFIWNDVSDLLFALATLLIQAIWPFLEYLSKLPFAMVRHGDISIVNMLLSIAGLVCIYQSKKVAHAISSRYWNNRYKRQIHFSTILCSVLMIVPIFVNSRQPLSNGEFTLTVLDVGQGSAAVLQTKNHVLVFDSGAKYSDRFDAGSSVVVPYLRHAGITSIDTMIISHGDLDHIGGAQAILDVFPDIKLVGQDIDQLRAHHKSHCIRGMNWQWDDVSFEVLSPAIIDSSRQGKSGQRNNHSCVVKVSSISGSLLLTGDIEQYAENELVAAFGEELDVDVVIVPHHGSKTSSSQSFIEVVDAGYAIFSVGYRNRYRLPNKQVVLRYERSLADILRTDESGAVTVHFTRTEGINVERYRHRSRRYWYHNMTSDSVL